MADVPHIALPIQILNRTYYVNEQDSEEDVADCIRAIISTEREFRPELPDFGILDPTFSTMPINTNDIVNQINQWEPRADVDIQVEFNPDGTQKVHVRMLRSEDDEEF